MLSPNAVTKPNLLHLNVPSHNAVQTAANWSTAALRHQVAQCGSLFHVVPRSETPSHLWEVKNTYAIAQTLRHDVMGPTTTLHWMIKRAKEKRHRCGMEMHSMCVHR